MIKRQDILVLATLLGSGREGLSYANLANKAKLSVSETFAAIGRLKESGWINRDKRVNKRNTEEFLEHALKYICPAHYSNKITSGVPASYAAPVASNEFAVSGNILVWPHAQGSAVGRSLEPIYPTALEAALADKSIYDNLALIDMLRGGRLRERIFAMNKIREIMSHELN